MPKVTFVNEMVTVEAKAGETLLQVAERTQINVFRGLFQGFHCKRMSGWCGRCKVWASPLTPGAVNEKTKKETGFHIGGSVPKHGTMRLACQVVVSGDVEVRTRSGFEIQPNATWEEDPRNFKWKERWARRNDEPDEDEKPKKAAAKPAAAKAGAAAPKVGAQAKSPEAQEASDKAAPPPTNEPPPAVAAPDAMKLREAAPDALDVKPPPAQPAAPATTPGSPAQAPDSPPAAPAPSVTVPPKEAG